MFAGEVSESFSFLGSYLRKHSVFWVLSIIISFAITLGSYIRGCCCRQTRGVFSLSPTILMCLCSPCMQTICWLDFRWTLDKLNMLKGYIHWQRVREEETYNVNVLVLLLQAFIMQLYLLYNMAYWSDTVFKNCISSIHSDPIASLSACYVTICFMNACIEMSVWLPFPNTYLITWISYSIPWLQRSGGHCMEAKTLSYRNLRSKYLAKLAALQPGISSGKPYPSNYTLREGTASSSRSLLIWSLYTTIFDFGNLLTARTIPIISVSKSWTRWTIGS